MTPAAARKLNDEQWVASVEESAREYATAAAAVVARGGRDLFAPPDARFVRNTAIAILTEHGVDIPGEPAAAGYTWLLELYVDQYKSAATLYGTQTQFM